MACKTPCQFGTSDVEEIEAVKNWVCSKCKEIVDNANCLKDGAVALNAITETPTTGLNAIAGTADFQAALKDLPEIKDNNIKSFAVKKYSEHDSAGTNNLVSVFLASKAFVGSGAKGPAISDKERLAKISTAAGAAASTATGALRTAIDSYRSQAQQAHKKITKIVQCSQKLQQLNQEYLSILNQAGAAAEKTIDKHTGVLAGITGLSAAEQAELDKAKKDLEALKRLGYGTGGAGAAAALGAAVAGDQQQVKRIFQEQCFLLAKIDKLAEYKMNSIEYHEARNLPFVSDSAPSAPNAGSNASLMVQGEPWGFMNRLTQDPSFSYLFEAPNYAIGQLSPMITLQKIITDADGKESEVTINFDSAAQEAKDALRNKDKRGFGVGIKKFTWAYRGSDPFAVKKSIEAKLVIFASSFDDLLKVRTNGPGQEYRYVDLALKTGTNLKKKVPKAHPESIEAMVDNLGKLEFRLKAVVGYAIPQGGSVTKAGLNTAIYNSFVTLNLTPTIHEFDIDEMGRVTFTCNYLAYVEDFFDQPNFNVFSDTAANTTMIKRKLLFKYLSKSCLPADLAAAKKDEAAMIDLEKKANLRSIANKLLQWKKVRFIEIPYEKIRDFLQQGPAYDWDPYTAAPQVITDDTATITQKTIFDDLSAGFDPTSMWAVDAPTSLDLAEYVTFFYLSDLVDVVLDGIQKNLNSMEGAIDTIDDSRITQDDKDEEKKKIQRLKDHFANFRVVLGPMEIYDPNDPQTYTHVNLGDIPISLKYFMDWLTDKTLKKESAIYPLPKFLNDLMNNFVKNFLNTSSCFDTNIKQKIRVNQSAITGYRNKTKDGFSPFDEITDLILHQRKYAEDRPDEGWETASRLWGGTWDTSLPMPLLNVMGRRNEYESSPGLEPEINYLTYFAGRVQPNERMNGNYGEDKKNGIFHYILGRDGGLVKNIQLQKSQMGSHKEVRFEQEGYDGLLQLREVYDANISAFLIPNAFPGTYIYVEPQSFAPATNTYSRGSNKQPIDPYDLSSYGIGGYYMIIESHHSIGPGEFNTEITSKWVAQLEKEADKSKPPESDPSEDSAKSDDPRCKISLS